MPRTEKQNLEIREKTKNLVLSSALKLFSTKGYYGTSISDIAADAGISKGLVYNYFNSKLQIVEAIFKQVFELEIALAGELKKTGDPYEKLQIMINASFDMTKDYEEYWKLYLNLALQPDILETSQQMTSDFIKSILKITVKIFRNLGFKNANAEARLFLALFDGLGIHYIADKENFQMEKMRKYCLKKYSKESIQKMLSAGL